MEDKFNLTKIIVTLQILALLGGLVYFFFINKRSETQAAVSGQNLQKFSAATLKQFDGTNPDLPIYLALDGYVYDVTPGKKFYGIGGTYHNLAGIDASSMLHVFGGDIIKQKYKITGVYLND